MKNFGKLAVLGAALAVSATSAFAIPYTGNIDITDTPVPNGSVVFTPGVNNGVSTLGSVTITSYNGANTFPVTTSQPTGSGTAPNLEYYVGSNVAPPGAGSATDDTLGNINSSSIANEVLWTGYNVSGPGSPDEVIFTASALGSTPTLTDSTQDISFIVYGSLTDSGTGGFSPTAAMDNVSYDHTTGTLTEDITILTPEPNSLMLLGTGLLSGAGMLMRRRRVTA